jgi:PAS domain-containing protein
MPLSIKTKQVAAVTAIVGLAVVVVSAWYVSSLAGYVLSETQARAKLIGDAVRHRMQQVVGTGEDPLGALRTDDGLAAVLQASLYSENVMYAAVVDTRGLIINHSDRARIDTRSTTPTLDLSRLVEAGPFERARALWASEAFYEFRYPLVLDTTDFGTVLVGISLPVMRSNLEGQVREVAITTGIAILLTSFVAMLLAQITLRPIHMIRTGLARLSRGETDVDMELPDDAELAALGDSFKAVTARLAADRSALDGQRATLESVVDNLEDAVALFGPTGALLFANPAMESTFAAAVDQLELLLPKGHPYRTAVEQTLAKPESPQRPTRVQMPGGGERLVQAHPVEGPEGRLLGVMLVARNLTYLTHVESTLSYSRKLAALGRLSAGIAHEVKNPLNATMIHLELLKMQVAGNAAALDHVATIVSQVRRLDEVVQGFLKFTRPEDLQLQAVDISQLVSDLMPIVNAEAGKHRVDVRIDFRPGHAAAGVPEPGAQRLPGHAERGAAAYRGIAHRRAADRRRLRGHGRRHHAGGPVAHFRSVLHDEGAWQRHRPVAGVPHGTAARWGDRGAVGARSRHHLPRAAARGPDHRLAGRALSRHPRAQARCARHHPLGFCVIMAG